jgi:hypothetical protein
MRIVDSTSEWDINPDGFDTGAAPVIFNGSPVEIEDCVAEDGRHLKKDCVMLLIDMEAQNIDADSDMMSVDNKKYRFRADGFYVHLNPEHIQTQTSDSYQMIAYFSEMGQLENESAWCYEMKPGETKTYTIGIFLDDTLKTGGASGELDLSNLYLNDKMSLIDNNAIQLSEVDLYD